jgi:hypothetical protein
MSSARSASSVVMVVPGFRPILLGDRQRTGASLLSRLSWPFFSDWKVDGGHQLGQRRRVPLAPASRDDLRRLEQQHRVVEADADATSASEAMPGMSSTAS